MPVDSLGTIPPLPSEIWECILNGLRWDSHSTLQALSLSCRGFRRRVLPILFESLHLHFRKKHDWGRQMLRDLAEHAGDDLYRCVRILIVSGGFVYEPKEDAPLLLSLVENLSGLVAIRWRGRFPFPDGLFRNLDARPSAPSLYFEGHLHNLTVAPSGQSSRCIRSVSVACYQKEHLDGLKPVVLSLPCLDRLDIKYLARSQGSPAPVFALHPGEVMPPLRTLCLTNISFDAKRAKEWAQCLQCHRLQHLGLDGRIESMKVLTYLTGRVPDLTSLALRISNGSSPDISDVICSRIDTFLQNVNALTAFTAYDLSKDVLSLVVSHHSAHLRRLRFRQTDFNCRDPLNAGQTRCLFTFEELENLAAALPRLQRLGIDLRFKEQLSYDILSGTACFPGLKHLELNTNFPYGEHKGPVTGPLPMVDSWLNAAVAEDAFRYVAGEKAYYERIARTAGSTAPWVPLMAIDIKVGEWEPLVDDYYSSKTRAMAIFMYACRWISCRRGKVDTVRLRCRAEPSLIEDDRYEQALASAGLCSVSKLLSGPWSL